MFADEHGTPTIISGLLIEVDIGGDTDSSGHVGVL